MKTLADKFDLKSIYDEEKGFPTQKLKNGLVFTNAENRLIYRLNDGFELCLSERVSQFYADTDERVWFMTQDRGELVSRISLKAIGSYDVGVITEEGGYLFARDKTVYYEADGQPLKALAPTSVLPILDPIAYEKMPSTAYIQNRICSSRAARKPRADHADAEFLLLHNDVFEAWNERDRSGESYRKSLARIAMLLLELADRAGVDLGEAINEMLMTYEEDDPFRILTQVEQQDQDGASFEEQSFAGSNPADFVVHDGILKHYSGHSRHIVIPDGVIAIGDYAFYEQSELRSVIIPDGVASIGESSFSGCRSLTKIEIPESVKSIGEAAFSHCDSLADKDGFVVIRDVLYYYCGENRKHVVIPSGVTTIGAYAFCRQTELRSVTIPDSVVSIGNNAFDRCSSLTEIEIPDSVTRIGEEAFWDCEGLADENGFVVIRGVLHSYYKENCRHIVIPDNVTQIGAHAFWLNSDLSSVVIPEGVTSIAHDAFAVCENLVAVIMPKSLTSIGERAFDVCTNLRHITMPNKEVSIGDMAFEGCLGLADEDGFIIFEDVLYSYCGKGGTVTIPNGVKRIANKAFFRCDELTGIIIPDSVVSIGPEALFGCGSLSDIVIPDTVTGVDLDALRG